MEAEQSRAGQQGDKRGESVFLAPARAIRQTIVLLLLCVEETADSERRAVLLLHSIHSP